MFHGLIRRLLRSLDLVLAATVAPASAPPGEFQLAPVAVGGGRFEQAAERTLASERLIASCLNSESTHVQFMIEAVQACILILLYKTFSSASGLPHRNFLFLKQAGTEEVIEARTPGHALEPWIS